MRVALFGGTGFVGSYLVDALIEAGMQPVLLVRPGNESRVQHRANCEIVTGDLDNSEAVTRVLDGADAAIYNVGILREFPERGITFEKLHHERACKVMRAAQRAGVDRFLLMSANGVKAQGTPYQASKFKAEQCLADSGMDWTVFRPSVIFGDPRGRSEFATQLLRDVVASPMPAPLFYGGLLPRSAGGFAMSPVQVQDVAKAFVEALKSPATIGQVIPLGGPRPVTWREILAEIATAVGRKKLMVPVPALGVSALAALLDRFESFPVTRDQLTMLLEGNTCSDDAFAPLGITPTPFDSGQLSYLRGSGKEDGACLNNVA